MEVADTIPQSVFNTQHRGLYDFLKSKDATVRSTVRKHQVDAVMSACEQLRSHPDKPALVVLPTGCGKTGVAVLAAYALNASRVLVITPSLTISKQIHEEFCGNPSEKKDCFLLKRGIITDRKQLHKIIPSGKCIKATSEIREHMSDCLMVVNAHKIGKQSDVKIADIPHDSYDFVIVDEAHHYPAPTWKLLVDHFHRSRRLFLTATPKYGGDFILPDSPPCFTLLRPEAVRRGIIRDLDFFEVPIDSSKENFQTKIQKVALKVREFLDKHDKEDRSVKHQAMVMAQTVGDLNSAQTFQEAYEEISKPPDICKVYAGDAPKTVLDQFDNSEIRTLVVVGKLREGYDNHRVSVVCIVRNVARQSKVLFTQFVGRAVRKAHKDDEVTAMIVSHEIFKQKGNFIQFDTVTDEENVDEH